MSYHFTKSNGYIKGRAVKNVAETQAHMAKVSHIKYVQGVMVVVSRGSWIYCGRDARGAFGIVTTRNHLISSQP